MEKRENIGAFYVLDDKRVVYLMGDKTLDDVNLDDLPVMETWPKDQDKFEQAFIYSEYIMSDELSEQFIRIQDYGEQRTFSVNFSKLCSNMVPCKEAPGGRGPGAFLVHTFFHFRFPLREQAGASFQILRVARMKRRGGSSVQSFARAFYNSSAWQKCRDGYKVERGGLCERCLASGLIVPGDEVHHRIKLTPENVEQPEISLNWKNLELLCKDCHIKEHRGKRWRADELGRVEL